jgi:hypothetical protein
MVLNSGPPAYFGTVPIQVENALQRTGGSIRNCVSRNPPASLSWRRDTFLQPLKTSLAAKHDR